MEFLNLKAEMVRRRITQGDIANAIGVSRESAHAKINGRVPFTLSEAQAIHKTYFPEINMSELFARDITRTAFTGSPTTKE